MGGQVEMAELGVVVEPNGGEPTVNLRAARLLRRIQAKFYRLDHNHQHVLMLHYCRPKYKWWDPVKERAVPLSEIEIAAAHKAWREIK